MKLTSLQNRNVFVDANVIFDYLLDRKFYADNAFDFFDKAQKYSVNLYVCSYTFAIAYYHMNKRGFSHNETLNRLEELLTKIECLLAVDEKIIRQAMKSGFNDFEDAIQFYCASNVPKCEAIITRNSKDFMLSNIPAVKPQNFFV